MDGFSATDHVYTIPHVKLTPTRINLSNEIFVKYSASATGVTVRGFSSTFKSRQRIHICYFLLICSHCHFHKLFISQSNDIIVPMTSYSSDCCLIGVSYYASTPPCIFEFIYVPCLRWKHWFLGLYCMLVSKLMQ